MVKVKLRVPREEANALLKLLDQKKVKYESDSSKGFLPLEILGVAVALSDVLINILNTYLENQKKPSEIILETPDGDLHLTAKSIEQLRLNFKKTEQEKKNN